MKAHYLILLEENEMPFVDSDVRSIVPIKPGTIFFIDEARQVTIVGSVTTNQLSDISSEMRRRMIKTCHNTMYDLMNTCSHDIEVPPKFYEKLRKDKWHSAGAHCLACGQRFGWFCPDSENHLCVYAHDSCIYCGMPEERK